MNIKSAVLLNECATSVARFNADSDRANLNGNRNPQNANSRLGITCRSRTFNMRTYNNLYKEICSKENLFIAYKKARKGKSKKKSVLEFEKNLDYELEKLREELLSRTYQPQSLKRFIVRDPKTRIIHASAFRDRIVHHAIINVIGPIFEKIFIFDSFANRIGKGTHSAIKRFDCFKRKVSRNGRLVREGNNANSVEGYVFKVDIKHYFDTINHNILIDIIKEKIIDERLIWLIRIILENFSLEGKGMPLGNLTSQFFANVYLNKLDYFVKYKLKVRFYIRYVDDFVILHRSRKRLEYFKGEIIRCLGELKLEIHPDKSKIEPLQKGTQFLGYRIFYHYKLLRKRNLYKFRKNFIKQINLLVDGRIGKEQILGNLQGWFGYARWANTYNLRKGIMKEIKGVVLDKTEAEQEVID